MINWSNPNNPVIGASSFDFRNGSSSIADSNGILLYTGYNYNVQPVRPSVWNKYNNDINDSIRIKGGLWYHASLFVPDPGNDSIIYLFTIGVTQAEQYGLYYSKINYKANNDSGIVIQKNVQLNNFPAFDALMAVRHGNGRDWWLIFQRWYTNNTATSAFYLYYISDTGISGPSIQNTGSLRRCNGGQLVFSSNADKFAQVSIRGMIELYTFDRCTGTITSTISIEQEPAVAPYPHWYASCAFSPDDSKLYVAEYSQTSSPSYLWQFDLMSANIPASKTVIDSFVDPDMGIAQLRLAPDNKIYLSASDEGFPWPYPDTITAFTTINNNLSVINYPDSLGAACDFQPFSFNLGAGRTYYGLPNNPDYELGAWVGSPCDTLSVGLTLGPAEEKGAWMQAWYNHEWNMIHVNAAQLKGKKGVLRLFDIEGRIVFEKPAEVVAGGYYTTEIYMNELSSGVYVVNLVTDRETLSFKTSKY